MKSRYFFPLGKARGKAFCNRTTETAWLNNNIKWDKKKFYECLQVRQASI